MSKHARNWTACSNDLRYLLDTNAVTALLSGIDNSVSQRLRQHAPPEVAISSVVSRELFYGAFKSQRIEHNVARVDGLRFEVLPFDHEDAVVQGQIRAQLANAGTPLAPTIPSSLDRRWPAA